MSETLTGFDLIILGILALSGLMALLRGFVREALSALAFILAALGALWMLPVLRETVRGAIQPDWAADAVTVGGAFLLIFIAVSLIAASLSRGLGRDAPGMVDRLAGLAFGIVRGLVFLAFFVIAYAAVAPRETPARWMTEAQLYPLVASTAGVLRELAPDNSRLAAIPAPPPVTETDMAPHIAPPATGDADDDIGYSDSAADALDRLIGTAAQESSQGDAQ